MFDDSLNDLQRIAQYSTSRIALQRLVHVKMLTCVAQEYPFQVRCARSLPSRHESPSSMTVFSKSRPPPLCVRVLACHVPAVLVQSVEEVAFPLLEALVADAEVVIRQHVAEQIRGLATVCAETGTEKGYRLLVDQLLHHLNKLVSDDEAVVRLFPLRCHSCHLLALCS
jgi:serine/threonine-protein phosphatase 4 regulatory subunit 1